MRPFDAPILTPAMPEIVLAALSMILLMVGVAGKRDNYALVSGAAIASLAGVAALVIGMSGISAVTFGGMFVADGFGGYVKVLVLVGGILSLLLTTGYAVREGMDKSEYPVLVLMSTLGMMLMVSATDLMSLYMAIELQSLPLYVLAAFRRDDARASEAGLKYFILGALSSGMLLYGMSLIYGFSGSTNFDEIALTVAAQPVVAPGLIVGLVLLLTGLAFKISAVPFHMWAPDVYEGAPTPVTAFFAIAPKVAAIALIVRVLMDPFAGMENEWRQIIIALSVLSMLIGAVGAVLQSNIKRLLAYSSIGHMGYALMGLAAAGAVGVQAVLVYITLYMVMSAGVFAVVLRMKRNGAMVENISDLAGVSKQQPMLAFMMAALMFSMAGIPPLAGFFGKLLVFKAAVDAGFYPLAIFGVLTSVVAAYYYLRVIKVMYFDNAAPALDIGRDIGLSLVLKASAVVVLFFVIWPSPLLEAATAAAQALVR